ncbi:hypothetical protein BGX31_011139 [Mortierella sp. GBA43]|nr:hypothetical protein BGX31_011139 [Mortierella sp. GBA43]
MAKPRNPTASVLVNAKGAAPATAVMGSPRSTVIPGTTHPSSSSSATAASSTAAASPTATSGAAPDHTSVPGHFSSADAATTTGGSTPAPTDLSSAATHLVMTSAVTLVGLGFALVAGL